MEAVVSVDECPDGSFESVGVGEGARRRQRRSGGYLLGDLDHVSGILLVVPAAIVIGNLDRPHSMSAMTQQAADIFWNYVAFVLNTATFALIGLAVPIQQLIAEPGAIAVGIASPDRACGVGLPASSAPVSIPTEGCPCAGSICWSGWTAGQRWPLRWRSA